MLGLVLRARGRGLGLAALAVGTPWLAISGGRWFEYFFNRVPFRSIIVDRFDALRDVAQVGAPVLVLHGDRDDVVPQRLGRQLYDAAADPKEAVWIPGGHHNDLWSRGAGDAIVRFVTARTR